MSSDADDKITPLTEDRIFQVHTDTTVAVESDSTKADSTKNDSTKDDSTKDGSTKDDSTKDDSPKDDSAKDDSAKDDSTKDDSVIHVQLCFSLPASCYATVCLREIMKH